VRVKTFVPNGVLLYIIIWLSSVEKVNQTEFWQLIDATHQAAVGNATSQEIRLKNLLSIRQMTSLISSVCFGSIL
jgi:hypothetical protein